MTHDSPWSRGRINACQAFEPSSSLGGEIFFVSVSPLTQLVECTTVNRDAASSILAGRVVLSSLGAVGSASL